MAESKSEKNRLEKRQAELQDWFFDILPSLDDSAAPALLQALSGDASFRRYFTSTCGDRIYVLVDAPPEKEDAHTFVQIAGNFLTAGINVPEVFASDFSRGFLCLSFLGETLLWEHLDQLRQDNRLVDVNQAYHHAFDILLKIQGIREGSEILLPPYDSVLLGAEVDLFRDWFCGGIMKLELTSGDHELLDGFFEHLIDSALGQTQVCVHRDYHSRNLLYAADGNFGVLDFQDAVIGPVTYDLVSLIKDCYISWPKAMIKEWALNYANMAQTAGIIPGYEADQFLYAFDMMGVQRHLKAIGIFSRLYLRDGKAGYLADIPRTMAYIKEVLADYPQHFQFAMWLEKHIYPMLWTRLRAVTGRNAGQ